MALVLGFLVQEQKEAPLRSFRRHLQDHHLAAGVEFRGRAQLGRDFLHRHPLAAAVGPVQVRLPLVAPAGHQAVPAALGRQVHLAQRQLETKVRVVALEAASLQVTGFLPVAVWGNVGD